VSTIKENVLIEKQKDVHTPQNKQHNIHRFIRRWIRRAYAKVIFDKRIGFPSEQENWSDSGKDIRQIYYW
jgi:hypothetical protein